NWGVVDVSSPSDVINSSVIFHPMRTLKRGAPAVQTIFNTDSFGFHAIYIPIRQRSLLPSEDSRWLPRTVLIDPQFGGVRAVIPKFMEYEIDPHQTLDHALEHNYGAKISTHLGSWDLQAFHVNGAATSPKVRFNRLEFDVGAI